MDLCGPPADDKGRVLTLDACEPAARTTAAADCPEAGHDKDTTQPMRTSREGAAYDAAAVRHPLPETSGRLIDLPR